MTQLGAGPDNASRSPSHAVALLAVGLALLVGFDLLCGVSLFQSRQQAWKRAIVDSNNIAALIERDVARNIEVLDLALQGTQKALAMPGLERLPPALLQDALFDNALNAPFFGASFVLDATGRALFDSAATPARRVDASDRPYFLDQRAGIAAQPSVGTPVLDRLDRQFEIPVSRRLTDAQGRFAGVVVGVLRPGYIRQLAAPLDLGPQGIVTVAHTDGTVVMRLPYRDEMIARNLTGAPVFEQARKQGWRGYLFGKGKLDGVRRLYVFRRIGSTPLIINVAFATADILAPWYRRAAMTGTAMFGLTLMAGLVILLLLREWRARARAEAAARSASRALQVLNGELTIRIADALAAQQDALARLAQTQRMEALGQLASGVAHDFNNVVQSIQGATELLQARAGDPKAVERLAGMVLNVCDRGAGIVGRLTGFSRKGDLRAAPIEVDALLQNLAEILRHTVGARISITVDTQPGLPPLFADPMQLETVLVNMATNARDAMPSTGGELCFEADVSVMPGLPVGGIEHCIRLRICDNGSGMDEATLAHAAEPFFTTKPIGKGTGLGLSMARGFCERSGGMFDLASRLGHGTCVTLFLPMAHAGRSVQHKDVERSALLVG